MKPFEVGKTYKTRCGDSVRVIAVDAIGDYPIIGLRLADGVEIPHTWTTGGAYNKYGHHGRFDLIPEKETRKFDADDNANGNRIACIPVTFEVP